MPEESESMVWAATIDGKTIEIRELRYGVLKRIAREETAERVKDDLDGEVLVGNLLVQPARYAERLYTAAAAALGVENGDPSEMSAKAVLDAFDLVPDTVPVEMGSGEPDPTDGSAPKTAG